MADISLSASLVVYKPDFSLLSQTLNALHRAAQETNNYCEVHYELTLVDNSNDVEWHMRLQAWVNEQVVPDWEIYVQQARGNIGYGLGNNLVIEKINSNYHMVINPDLFVDPDALLQAVIFMQANPDVGLLTPAVFSEAGEQNYLCKKNPTLFIMFLRGYAPVWLKAIFQARLDAFEMREHDYKKQIEGVQFPTGCFMFFRTARLRELGGFDGRFFMYFEDADIGRRMLKVARVVYVPSVRVVHRWARDAHRSWQMRWVFIRSALTYYKKWGGLF